LVEEVNSGEVMVEKAGYIPADEQIRNMIEAGMRLGEYRREEYDYAEEEVSADEPLPPVDPTRSQEFDMADASQISLGLRERLKEARDADKAKKKAAEPAAEQGEKAEVVPPPKEG